MTDSINVESNLSHSETNALRIKKELLSWCQYDKLQALFPKEFLVFQLAQKILLLLAFNIRAVSSDILFRVSANEIVYFGGWLMQLVTTALILE